MPRRPLRRPARGAGDQHLPPGLTAVLLLTDPPRPHPPHTLLSSSYLTLLTDSFCSSPSPSLATLPTHALSLPLPSHLYVLRHLLRHPSYNQAAIASRYEALVAARTDLPTEQELAGRIAALRVAASGMVQLELTQQERVLLERERLHRNDAGVQHEAMRAVTRVRAWVYANGKWLLKWWLGSAAAVQVAGLLYWVFLCTGCSKFSAHVGEPMTLIEILGQTKLFYMLSAVILCLSVADRAATDVAKYLITTTFSRMRGWVNLMLAPRQAWHVDVLIICFLCAVAFGWQHLELRTSDPDAIAQLTLHLPNTTTVQYAAGFARSLTLVAIDQQTIGHGSSFALLVNLGIRLHAFYYHNEKDLCSTLDMSIRGRIVKDFVFGREIRGGLIAVLVPSQCMALELAYAAERRLVSSARANEHWVTAGELHDHDAAEAAKAAEAMRCLWQSWWGLKIMPFVLLTSPLLLVLPQPLPRRQPEPRLPPSFDNLCQLCVGGILFGTLFIYSTFTYGTVRVVV